jgi:putative transcriptional regulator
MALEDKARGQRIAQLRKRRRLTQQAMAERLRIGYRTYQTWEGGTMPEYGNLEKLAKFFGVKPEYLIGEEGVFPDAVSQLDRIEAEQQAINAKLDAILDRLDVKPEPVDEIVSDFEREFDAEGDRPDGAERRRRDRRRA